MALKYKNVEEQGIAEAEYKGSWGEIAREEVRCIHFVLNNNHRVEEVWTYPYETLLRWTYRKGMPEELILLLGGDTVTICGHSLERFVEALEGRHLHRVEQQPRRFASAQPNDCYVSDIKIEALEQSRK